MANHIEYLKEEGIIDTLSVSAITQGIIESYIGTCDIMANEDFDWLDSHDMLGEVGNEIFRCTSCGWWCADGEQSPNNETVCDECDPYE